MISSCEQNLFSLLPLYTSLDRRDENDKKEQGEKQVKSVLGKTYPENQIKDCGK